MKREITRLEQKLIDNGYKLAFKSYVGKHSQKVEFYAYKGHLEDYEIIVYLNSKRNLIDHYVFENKAPKYLGCENIYTLERVYKELTDFIYSISDSVLSEESPEEIVEILESEND